MRNEGMHAQDTRMSTGAGKRFAGDDVAAWASRERANVNRARQFIPFAALRGFDGLVEERSHVDEPRHELTPEQAEELSRAVASLSRGEHIRATFYEEARGAYVSLEGAVGQVDPTFGTLRVSGRRIRFSDLLAVESMGGDAAAGT